MNKNSFVLTRRAAAPLAALAAVPLAFILAQPAPAVARNTDSGMISSKTEQGYAFMSGGVGIGERNVMQRKARAYDLDLSFANRQGQYLSDIKVIIDNEHGKQIVDSTTTGPLFYIELPPGKYDVKATFDNKTEEVKNLNISKNHSTKELLHWNVPESRVS